MTDIVYGIVQTCEWLPRFNVPNVHIVIVIEPKMPFPVFLHLSMLV